MSTTSKKTKVVDYESLNNFLMESVNEVDDSKVSFEKAKAISQLTDKIISNNISKILESKRIGDKTPITFFKAK